MKKKAINLVAAALCFIILFPQRVWGADVNITYQTKETAKTGDKVNVEIDVSGNKPITTLGLRLTYDSDKLTYESDSWSKGVKDVNAMTLVSDVKSNGGKVLNISLISDAGYQADGNMVTLSFTAKEDYASVPVELVLRDITDKDMQDISTSTSVTLKKQDDNNRDSNENSDQNNSQNNNENNNQNNSETTGDTNQNTGTGSGDNTSTTHTGESGGTSNVANSPTAYKTGIEIMDHKVLSLGGIFLAAGIFCILLKRKLSR